MAWRVRPCAQDHGLTRMQFFCPHAPTLSITEFALISVQTHILKQIRIEMCVCTLLNVNPVVERVGAHVHEGKNNFSGLTLSVIEFILCTRQ